MDTVEPVEQAGPYVEADGARVYASVEDGMLVIRIYTGDDTLPVAISVNDTPAGQMLPSRARGRHRKQDA